MSAGATLLTASAVAAGTYTQVLGPQVTSSSGAQDSEVGINPSRIAAMAIQLNVTAVATSVNVYFQHSIDGGTTWDDFISFTQLVAPGIVIAEWYCDYVDSSAMHTKSDGALTAGTVLNGIVGDDWRIKYVTVGASTSFTVTARQRLRSR
jgi:hypothetical protein